MILISVLYLNRGGVVEAMPASYQGFAKVKATNQAHPQDEKKSAGSGEPHWKPDTNPSKLVILFIEVSKLSERA